MRLLLASFLVLTASGENSFERTKNISIRGVGNDEFSREMSNLMNADQWQCGTAGLQSIARGTIKIACQDKLTVFNMCCAVHDDCYKMQKGKKNCDRIFCNCLEEAMKWKTSSCSRLFSKGSCKAVGWFGDSAYEDKSDDDEVKEYTPALNKTVKVYYKKVYASCWDIRKTISNCAYNHMVCHLKGLPLRSEQSYEHCVDQVIKCLDESSLILVDNFSDCRAAVEAAIRAIALDSEHSGFKPLQKPKLPKKFYAIKPAPIYKQN